MKKYIIIGILLLSSIVTGCQEKTREERMQEVVEIIEEAG